MFFTLHSLASSQPMNIILDYNSATGEGALWLGDITAANNRVKLQEKDIRTVITVAQNLNVVLPASITHKIYNILDIESQNIKRIWNDTYLQISQGMQRGSVLVHCAAGVSRSASTVIAFLMKKKSISCDEAFNFVKKRRPIICPNFGFQRQLREYEKDLQQSNQTTVDLPVIWQSNYGGWKTKEDQRKAYLKQLQQVWSPQIKKHEDPLLVTKDSFDEVKKQMLQNKKPYANLPTKKQSDIFYSNLLSTNLELNNSSQIKQEENQNFNQLNLQKQLDKQVNDYIQEDSLQTSKLYRNNNQNKQNLQFQQKNQK